MNFDIFLEKIPFIIDEALPGDSAHAIMAPLERRELMLNLNLEIVNPRKAAVLMLLYPKNSLTHLVLIVRNTYPGVHSSQIAFPGGKVETSDASLQQTALRETWEEIGIDPEKINVVRSFSDVYIPPSNFLVYPFLGFCTEELIFIPDPSEVAGILEVSLSDFLDEKNVKSKQMTTSYTQETTVPVFIMGEHVVWGATAMMLSELKEVLKKVL